MKLIYDGTSDPDDALGKSFENYDERPITNASLISICCGAPKLDDSDLCSDCGEHTSFEQEIEDERRK